MRVLIVGGGIAGLTLAALLRQRGARSVVVEKAASFGDQGYVLGLWPLGSRVLHGLGRFEAFVEASQPMTTYNVCNGHGEVLHSYDFADFNRRIGPSRMLTRTALLEVIRPALGDTPVRMNTSITALEQNEQAARVTFSDETQAEFDLVVGCDGIHSRVRELLWGALPLNRTGWAGYAFWVDPQVAPHDTVTELWGAGRFFGIYPTDTRLCVFNGMPIPADHREPREGRVARMRAQFNQLGGPVPAILEAVRPDADLFYTEYADIRVAPWHKGRVVLLGDAGSALLPTAGVGASMAMESAAVLSDELSRADAATVPHALDLFEKRRRDRLDHVQSQSRQLAKLMLIENTPLAFGRDQLMKFYSQEQFLKSFLQVYDQPI